MHYTAKHVKHTFEKKNMISFAYMVFPQDNNFNNIVNTSSQVEIRTSPLRGHMLPSHDNNTIYKWNKLCHRKLEQHFIRLSK